MNNAELEISLSGYELINNPRWNKGTAFTVEERDVFELHGLLPPHIGSLDDQVRRRLRALDSQPKPFTKYSLLRDLQDSNETLFYAMLIRDIPRLLPLVYTPTVGEGCQRFSEIWRKPRGLFFSYPNRERIGQILSHRRFDQVKCIVVSDGERILGLGDQGAGGMGIPIGKMALYTALGGIAPEYCLPVLLDVGTNNEERLNDPLYIGWRHRRIRGEEYDQFVDDFVAAVERRWPHILLQWEDFAGSNAARLLNRYRNRLCTFNDDIQGTAAVATGTLIAAMNVTGKPLRDQRIAIVGFGSAGIGIANLLLLTLKSAGLSDREAHSSIYALDRDGLLVEGANDVRPEQRAFVRLRADVESWGLTQNKPIELLDVVRHAQPTVLIGVSGKAGIFTEEAIREMAKSVERPVIFPLSNPTSRSEATPEQLLRWTEGRALVGTGSPFDPVQVNGTTVSIDQTNNSYTFPGLALGIISSKAVRVSDGMIMAAAQALARLSPTVSDRRANLLPPLTASRESSRVIAEAVGAQAIDEGLSTMTLEELHQSISANVWEPFYRPYRRVDA